MNQLFGGSGCLTDLIEQAKKGHSAFSKSQNGKVYFNFLSWINDKEDKFGNTMSHQLSSTKDKREAEGKIYFGNSKPIQTSKPVSTNDVDSDLSNVQERVKADSNGQTQEDNPDDLPF